MSKSSNKKELKEARRKAAQKASQLEREALFPSPDNRVRVVTYTDRDGKRIIKHCQDFKVIANDANACGIMWMGDNIEGQPGHREIIGQTFGVTDWKAVKEDLLWEEYSKKE